MSKEEAGDEEEQAEKEREEKERGQAEDEREDRGFGYAGAGCGSGGIVRCRGGRGNGAGERFFGAASLWCFGERRFFRFVVDVIVFVEGVGVFEDWFFEADNV